MIYIYNAEVLASLKNRSLGSAYNEYNLLYEIEDPTGVKPNGLSGFFYFYMHEPYDPLFLWNIEEIKQLRIEHGNHRFVGRALRAQLLGDLWLPTKLISPIPWTYVLADVRVTSLDKTLDIDFPSNKLFSDAKGLESIIIKGNFYDAIIRPYLKFPRISERIFAFLIEKGRLLGHAYEKFVNDNLSYTYILKNKDSIIDVLGNRNNPNIKEYDVNDYGGLMDAVLAICIDAEKEIT